MNLLPLLLTSQLLSVPDVSRLGIPGCTAANVCFPEPVEVDGDTSQFEFVVYGGTDGFLYLVNPRKFITPDLICWEPLPVPLDPRRYLVLQTTRTVHTTSSLITWGTDLLSAPYDIRPIKFDQCK